MLETICDILKDAYARNWITSRDGNISLRDYDKDHFFITPSGVRKQTLQPDQFKKIGLTDNGWEVLPYTAISSELQPSGEIPLHYGLQKELGQHRLAGIRVVVHVHPTYCVAAMHAGINLNELVTHFPELGRYTRVAPNVGEVPPISEELAIQCHTNLGLDSEGNIEYDIVGIKGHGVVAIDTSPWRAYEHIERLEHISKIILASGKYYG
jgi:ribulose-5-phosphate 4-epimerase/fuculose-1-phosphate aldolase